MIRPPCGAARRGGGCCGRWGWEKRRERGGIGRGGARFESVRRDGRGAEVRAAGLGWGELGVPGRVWGDPG